MGWCEARGAGGHVARWPAGATSAQLRRPCARSPPREQGLADPCAVGPFTRGAAPPLPHQARGKPAAASDPASWPAAGSRGAGDGAQASVALQARCPSVMAGAGCEHSHRFADVESVVPRRHGSLRKWRIRSLFVADVTLPLSGRQRCVERAGPSPDVSLSFTGCPTLGAPQQQERNIAFLGGCIALAALTNGNA